MDLDGNSFERTIFPRSFVVIISIIMGRGSQQPFTNFKRPKSSSWRTRSCKYLSPLLPVSWSSWSQARNVNHLSTINPLSPPPSVDQGAEISIMCFLFSLMYLRVSLCCWMLCKPLISLFLGEGQNRKRTDKDLSRFQQRVYTRNFKPS